MGLGMAGRVWEPQVQSLRVDHRVATYDHRGVGGSDPAAWTASMSTLADDAAHVLDALGWAHAHIVGLSLGGMIAQEFALRHPERCDTLTLIATHSGGPSTGLKSPKALWAFARTQTPWPAVRAAGLRDALYPKAWIEQSPPGLIVERIQARTSFAMAKHALWGQILAMYRHDTRARCAQITSETLVIAPTEDLLIAPRHCAALAKRIPAATLEVIKGAGHGVIFSHASNINALLREHFAQEGV
jgi:pimeloyl-ACP methyl ester carboxylesterase